MLLSASANVFQLPKKFLYQCNNQYFSNTVYKVLSLLDKYYAYTNDKLIIPASKLNERKLFSRMEQHCLQKADSATLGSTCV